MILWIIIHKQWKLLKVQLDIEMGKITNDDAWFSVKLLVFGYHKCQMNVKWDSSLMSNVKVVMKMSDQGTKRL